VVGLRAIGVYEPPWTYMGSEPLKISSVCGAERTGLKVDSERYIDKYSTCRNFHTFSRNVGFVLDATSGWICSSVAGITLMGPKSALWSMRSQGFGGKLPS
jgi:hypothetical protein